MVPRRAHLRENFIKPLKRSVKMHLDPTRGGGHVLAMIFSAPTLHEGHPDRAHLRQLVHGLEPEVDGLGEEGGELLVVEDLEAAAGRDFTDCGGVKPVVVVAVSRLHEDGRVAEALRVHLPTHVVEVDALADVSARVLDGGVAVDVGELAEAESVVVLVGGVREAVDDDGVVVGVVDLAHPGVQLVVGDGRPVGGFLVGHCVSGGGGGVGVVFCVHVRAFAFVAGGVGGRGGFGADGERGVGGMGVDGTAGAREAEGALGAGHGAVGGDTLGG